MTSKLTPEDRAVIQNAVAALEVEGYDTDGLEAVLTASESATEPGELDSGGPSPQAWIRDAALEIWPDDCGQLTCNHAVAQARIAEIIKKHAPDAGKVESRDGSWMDKWSTCRVCGGEIPHGHTNNCDVWKMEQQLTTLRERAGELAGDMDATLATLLTAITQMRIIGHRVYRVDALSSRVLEDESQYANVKFEKGKAALASYRKSTGEGEK